jgi:hypothetical protein
MKISAKQLIKLNEAIKDWIKLTESSQIDEVSTSRFLQHFTNDEVLAIISTYREERPEKENRRLLKELKSKVRDKGFGFTELLSRWAEMADDGTVKNSDERSLIIYGIPVQKAIKLGGEYQQSSIIVKDAEGCREVCTTDFIDYDGKPHKVGDTVRTFNVKDNDKPLNLDDAKEIMAGRKGGPASSPVKSNRPFKLTEMFEVESPRPSYFSEHERYRKIF